MKISSLSSLAINMGLRSTTASLQENLVRLQDEVVTGRFADTGLEIGERMRDLTSLRNEITRIEQFKVTQSRADTFLTGTQDALSQVSDIAQDFMASLVPAIGDNLQRPLVSQSAADGLETAVARLNAQIGGVSLFGGENTDGSAMEDYEGSALQASVEAAFVTRFGFAISDPATAGITAAQMDDFLANDLEPLFASPAWSGISNASDNAIVNRISDEVTVQIGVTANEEAVRDLFAGMVAAYAFYGSDLGADALDSVGTFALEKTSTSVNGFSQLRSEVGLTQARLARNGEQLDAQMRLLTTFTAEMEQVDVFEKSAELNSVITQIEISYSITSRVQQLSIMRFL
ncbi:MAG: flagellar hook-associated family protein [Pseudomonadota bacterium]